MWQHDLSHTARTGSSGSPGPAVKWTFPTALAPATPAIGPDGTVYLPTGQTDQSQGILYAITPGGSQRWAAGLSGPSGSTAPAVGADGTIYVHANSQFNVFGSSTLTAFNPNGGHRWQHTFNLAPTSGVVSSPAIAGDGRIWVGEMDTFLYRLNPSDGSIVCGVSPTASSISSSPAIGPDGTVYVMDVTNALFAFDQNCGQKWGVQLADFSGGDQSSPAVAADGTIWIGSPDHNLYAVTPNGAVRCSFATGADVSSTPAIGPDGTIYIGSDGLYAVNPANCSQKWVFRPFGVLFSSASPVVDGEGVIYWREAFNAYALNPNGTTRWSVPVGPSGGSGLDPSAAIGSLYWGDGGFFDSPTRLRAFASSQERCGGKPATVYGTGGKDKLKGSPLADVIVGLGGNDKISGGRGSDRICGGTGKDKLSGGPGNDKLIGGKGKDSCTGGKGRDSGKGCEQRRL
jgi:outer membrane protein assembly factor BamB